MTTGNNNIPTIRSFLNSDDPLSSEAIQKLINHKEEDLYVDYKECFDHRDEKHWVGITTDVMAFANTMGGYIVFGIRDSSFSIIGLPELVASGLANTNMIMQKLNRYVLPPFSMVRTKSHKTESGDIIVIMYIPESKGKTHIFIKDVNYKYPSGETKKLIHAGMIFIRRSATTTKQERVSSNVRENTYTAS